MSSTITDYSSLINVNFPIPGEDNDTQGFRDNFSRIQTSLSVASQEISNLQINAVNLSETNDFGYNILKRATLQNNSVVVSDVGLVGTSGIVVDYALGGYHKYTLSGGEYLFVISNWPPAGRCGTIRIEITPTSSDPVTINFGGVVTVLTKTVLPVSYTQLTPIIWDLWSPDNGTTLYAHELGIPSVLTENGANVFTAVNTFTQAVSFLSPANLASYTQAEANLLIGSGVETGAMIYISDSDKPAYFSSTGSWVTIG